MNEKNIPDIVVSRLPRYLQVLKQLLDEGNATTSSNELGYCLGLTPAQIRKDLSMFGGFGKQGTGYNIPFLIDRLNEILHLDRQWLIALVGVGDLGHALARYQGFTGGRFRICLLFDREPSLIGNKVGELTIRDSKEMIPLIKDSGIQIAMITVPPDEAQDVASSLVKAGVRAILNYAPVVLRLPPKVQVQNIDPELKLEHMTFYLE